MTYLPNRENTEGFNDGPSEEKSEATNTTTLYFVRLRNKIKKAKEESESKGIPCR